MKPASKLCLIATSLLMLGTGAAVAGPIAPVKANNVVLVHGSWADGSSWSEVITRLQAAGLHVTAVQNPLTSVADDVAYGLGVWTGCLRERTLGPLLPTLRGAGES